MLILKKLNKKIYLIGHLHGSDLIDLLNRNIYGKLLKKFYNIVLDKLIINSQSHKKYALGYEFQKYKIINNPFHLESSLFKKINNKHAYITGKINIVFISIPSKRKGVT